MATVSERPVTLASHLTVGELLRARARFTPHAIALADDEREWTYGQFNERVNRLAHALRTVNIEPGERIAVLSENRVEYLELTFACAKLGAIVCALKLRARQWARDAFVACRGRHGSEPAPGAQISAPSEIRIL